jgi:hypothetical protein
MRDAAGDAPGDKEPDAKLAADEPTADERPPAQRLGRSSPMVRRKRWSGRGRWLVPLAAFLVGLVVGAGALAATAYLVTDGRDPAGSDRSAAGETTAGPATGESGSAEPAAPAAGAERGITIPQACVDAVDDARRGLELLERGLRELRELDATGMQQVTDAAGRLQPVLQENVQTCRAELG